MVFETVDFCLGDVKCEGCVVVGKELCKYMRKRYFLYGSAHVVGDADCRVIERGIAQLDATATFYPNLIGQVPWDGDITDLLILGIEPDPAARESV